MPKAQPFSEEEEEKTTIESGWEDEASTTVEQGDVAEKIRSLAIDQPVRRQQQTGITATGASMLDEPTVDDQRANLALNLPTPVSIQARLWVTGGNDKGTELLLTPGKSYTIGRAVDNDIVLTDIAVSRKHFDLRYDAGAWVLVDRGSGNGTLVNNNIEDAPFMLANGDVIEIGNTTFKFEGPSTPVRPAQTVDVSMDESMDGSMHGSMDVGMGGQHDDDDEEEPSTVAGKPLRAEEISTPGQIPPPAIVRPKTLPPPAPPLRPRSPSAAPMQAIMYPAPIPSAAIPTLAHNNGRPAAHQPTLLGDGMGMPLPGTMPTTIPGQGVPMAPSQLPPGYNVAGYPVNNQQQMLVIGQHVPRDATSTALVPPTPYNGMPVVMAPQRPYGVPQLSRRTKLILAGAGLTLFAAIATVAIIKGSTGGAANAQKPDQSAEPVKQELPPKATVQPIDPPPQPTKVATPALAPTPAPTVKTPAPVPAPAPKIAVVAPPAPAPTPTKTVPVPAPAPTPAPTIAKKEPPPPVVKKEPAPVVKREPPPKKEPPVVAKKEPPPKREPAPKKEPPPKREPAPRRVATGDPSASAKAKAESQFKAKQFAAAATTLRNAAAAAESDDATDLKSAASVYERFGRAYNVAMAPATSAKDAFTNAKLAKNYDPEGVFSSEIQAKLAETAPKAAAAYIGAKDYANAKSAVAVAEANGGGNSTTAAVKQKLEQVASGLVKEAQGQLSSDPEGARAKLKQVQQMVDSKSPSYQKAAKLLASA